VYFVALHFAAAQVVVAPSTKPAQFFGSLPSQVRAAQIAPAPSSHADRAPRGTPLTGVHLPGVLSQASH
jgi:hypothetical protein